MVAILHNSSSLHQVPVPGQNAHREYITALAGMQCRCSHIIIAEM
jgi:hypothetical protein